MKTSIMIVLTAALFATITISINAEVKPGHHPWSQWKNMPQGKDFFPIGVWSQIPKNAGKYKELGVDYYFAMFKGPTEEQIKVLREYQMPLICHFNKYAQENLIDDPLIWGWMHRDEPDLAHVYKRADLKAPGGKQIIKEKWPEVYEQLDLDNNEYDGWGLSANPVIDIQIPYKRIKQADDSRPVFLQLSKAVACDGKDKGRGDQSGQNELYPQYIAGADIVSFDIYPVAYGESDKLWRSASGIDFLKQHGAANKPTMFICEAGFGDEVWADHHQQRAQVWMAINHGASSIAWFCHRWAMVDGVRTNVTTSMPLDDEQVGKAIKAINDEIHQLAAVINSTPVPNAVHTAGLELDLGIRQYKDALYIFAVERGAQAGQGVFEIPELDNATVQVINENRSIQVKNGRFADDFDPWTVHLYKISPNE